MTKKELASTLKLDTSNSTPAEASQARNLLILRHLPERKVKIQEVEQESAIPNLKESLDTGLKQRLAAK